MFLSLSFFCFSVFTSTNQKISQLYDSICGRKKKGGKQNILKLGGLPHLANSCTVYKIQDTNNRSIWLMSCHRIRKLPPNITVMFRTNIQQRFGPIWALCYCSDLCFGQPTLLLPLCCSRLSPRQHTCTILLSSKPRAPPGGRYLQVQARYIFSSSECSQYEKVFGSCQHLVYGEPRPLRLHYFFRWYFKLQAS